MHKFTFPINSLISPYKLTKNIQFSSSVSPNWQYYSIQALPDLHIHILHKMILVTKTLATPAPKLLEYQIHNIWKNWLCTLIRKNVIPSLNSESRAVYKKQGNWISRRFCPEHLSSVTSHVLTRNQEHLCNQCNSCSLYQRSTCARYHIGYSLCPQLKMWRQKCLSISPT